MQNTTKTIPFDAQCACTLAQRAALAVAAELACIADRWRFERDHNNPAAKLVQRLMGNIRACYIFLQKCKK